MYKKASNGNILRPKAKGQRQKVKCGKGLFFFLKSPQAVLFKAVRPFLPAKINGISHLILQDLCVQQAQCSFFLLSPQSSGLPRRSL